MVLLNLDATTAAAVLIIAAVVLFVRSWTAAPQITRNGEKLR